MILDLRVFRFPWPGPKMFNGSLFLQTVLGGCRRADILVPQKLQMSARRHLTSLNLHFSPNYNLGEGTHLFLNAVHLVAA